VSIRSLVILVLVLCVGVTGLAVRTWLVGHAAEQDAVTAGAAASGAKQALPIGRYAGGDGDGPEIGSLLADLGGTGLLGAYQPAIGKLYEAPSDPNGPVNAARILVEMRNMNDPAGFRKLLYRARLRMAQINADPKGDQDERRALAMSLLIAGRYLSTMGGGVTPASARLFGDISYAATASGEPQLSLLINEITLAAVPKDAPELAGYRENMLFQRAQLLGQGQDLTGMLGVAHEWDAVSRDQRPNVRGWRWSRLAASIIEVVPPEVVRDDPDAVWRGLSSLDTASLSQIGVQWLNARAPATTETRTLLRDAFVRRLDQEIERRRDENNPAELLKLEKLRNDAAGR